MKNILMVIVTVLCCLQASAQGKVNYKGNVQTVLNRMTMITRMDTTAFKITTRYNDDKHVTEEDHDYGEGHVLNHRVLYTYNTRGLLTNRITFSIGASGGEERSMDSYEYDNMDRLVKLKSISAERTDSTVYWYQAGAQGNTIRYSKPSYNRDTTIQVTDARGNVVELNFKSIGLHINYKYDQNDNVIEEIRENALDKKLNRRVTTEYNLDKMPVEIKEYNTAGKMVDESSMSYTNMDEQGNYRRTVCTRNGKLAYSMATEIVYKP